MFRKKLALAAATLTTLIASSAFAQSAAGGASSNAFDAQRMAALAAGIAIGMAVLGGTLGQGRAVASALEGIGRNPGAAPRIQTPMILGLALIESLVLFGFVIAYLLQSKVGVGG
jgi:F-type H+-transporting ATPase subunit c